MSRKSSAFRPRSTNATAGGWRSSPQTEIGTYAGTFKGLAGMAGTLVGGLVVAQ